MGTGTGCEVGAAEGVGSGAAGREVEITAAAAMIGAAVVGAGVAVGGEGGVVIAAIVEHAAVLQASISTASPRTHDANPGCESATQQFTGCRCRYGTSSRHGERSTRGGKAGSYGRSVLRIAQRVASSLRPTATRLVTCAWPSPHARSRQVDAEPEHRPGLFRQVRWHRPIRLLPCQRSASFRTPARWVSRQRQAEPAERGPRTGEARALRIGFRSTTGGACPLAALIHRLLCSFKDVSAQAGVDTRRCGGWRKG